MNSKDAIRDLGPRRIVLDDAHLSEDRIAVLRRLRDEMAAEFDIVAVSWPGQLAEVAAALVGSQTFDLRELDRDQILELNSGPTFRSTPGPAASGV